MARQARKPTSHGAKPSAGSQKPTRTSPAGRRPLTDDERIDEAVEESFGSSDPPAYSSPGRVGAPPNRQQKSKTQKSKKTEA